MNEFDLIKQYFDIQTKQRKDVIRGIGDDAAIVTLAPQQELVITTDTLIAGRHFPHATLPHDIGHKALAVNLSDLAAMGATPAWVMLALTLPQPDETWIQSFCEGFFSLAHRYHVQLIGGDLTRGPLSITIQALGTVPTGQALLRSQAKPTDLIYVSGTLGDAAAGLRYPQHAPLVERLNRPEPRIDMGLSLRGLASAAIDISDGLAADVTHILEESRVGALLWVDKLPLSQAMIHSLSTEEALALALTGGDDYELCFTVPAEKRIVVENRLSTLPCRYTCVGEITAGQGLDLCYQDGKKYNGPIQGYQHF